ncbi:MAG: hypothetical protein NVSMB28_06850 [Collimonas sp.]
MIFTLSTRLALFAAIVLLPFAASAQTSAEDPQNPQAATSSAPYKSVFSDYKSYQDPEVQPWKKSNADVSESDTMKDSSMGNMKGMSDKSMSDMKAKSPTPSGKKATSPSDPMPSSMPAHDGMQKH